LYDLKIVNGTLIDGTGAPRRPGDIGVKDGKIVAVGDAPEDAERVIDAAGRIVSPGFIDTHTHYDVQVMFDGMLSISPWHGVTTVVIGNCGFGIAPTREKDREFILRNLQHVEGMPYECTSTGMGDWGFETFPEYLDAIERHGVGPNIGVLLGHTPLRVFVMGEDAVRREATPEELAEMKRLAREAMDVGAIGFSTSQTKAHTGERGLPVPSRWSSVEELEGLIEVLGEVGNGTFAHNFRPYGQTHLPNFQGWGLADAKVFVERTGIRFCSESVHGTKDPNEFMDNTDDSAIHICDVCDELLAEGYEWTMQAGALPNTFEISLADPFLLGLDLPKAAYRVTPIDDLFVPILNLDRSDRLAAYEDPSFRERFREATDRPDWNERYWPQILVNYLPTRPEAEGKRLVALAREQGVHPSELMIDMGIESKLEVLFGAETSWSNARDEHQALLVRPSVVFGLSDGGAHMAQIADSRFPTNVLCYWVRERGLPLEWGVWMLTQKSADAFGIEDRGTLTPGLAADICVFDPDTVADGKLERRDDLPAHARRLVSIPTGLDYVIVNGTILRDHNRDTITDDTDLPGKVLRHFRPHAAHPRG
jgi:N-acyl-D-aspartate/D-glutamate deacylase